jgi:hypothetical protein
MTVHWGFCTHLFQYWAHRQNKWQEFLLLLNSCCVVKYRTEKICILFWEIIQ